MPSSVSASPRLDGPQPHDRCVEPGAAHRPRLDELVVAARDERARPQRIGAEQVEEHLGRSRELGELDLGRRRPRLALDDVARAVLGEEACRDRADLGAVPERAQLARLGDLADLGAVELPAVDHRFDLGEPLGRDDRHHPLLRLGDHDLPRLHPRLALGHAVEVHVDAVVGGHLGERRGEAGSAAVLQREHEPALDELDGDLDQALAGERVAHLHRRALVGRLLAELLAREDGCAADPVPSRRRAVEHEHARPPCRPARSSRRRRAAGRRTSR